jgi:outer membrane receptor for ferric coprogen and ferric-rhodotorulic acid
MYSNELIAEYQSEGRYRMTVTGFQYDYRDLITPYLDGDGLSCFQNAGKVRTRGVESEISANWQQWSGTFSHTFQNTNGSADQPSANSPHNLLKLRLSREMLRRRLTLSGELDYTSRVATQDPAQDAPGYLVANLTLLGRNILVPGLDASLSLHNLFDRHYAQPGPLEHLPVALIPPDGSTAGLRISYRY